MAKEKKKKTKKYKVLSSVKGSGTTYSVLYSTARSPGTRYSTVKDRSKELALAKRRKKK
ncbi:MAG: hypothetical protein QMD21_00815 [Candidatus Thermoplasmatota archaeon]|nr:hypothetical protein [Candidatus Thermoplasmatota archaeon]